MQQLGNDYNLITIDYGLTVLSALNTRLYSVLPILTYEAETWTMTAAEWAKLPAFH